MSISTIQFSHRTENEFISSLLLATRRGDVNTLESQLSTVTNPNLYLNRVYNDEYTQKCTLLTMACLKEYENMIRMLLCRFKPDLEILNNVIIKGGNLSRQIFLNVSVLWTAVSINNFRIVKLLVEHGADVNHTTETNSTPLRGACYHGNVTMARYLIENGANIHMAKKNNDTNLMVSVSHKHINMVTYLVDELNCDVNACDNDGRPPLYDAVICGSLELVEFLLKHGARNFRAVVDCMSPLMWAAEKRHVDLMEAISSQCSLLERIEAEELLGSAFICGTRGDRDIDQAFTYFYRALELRLVHNLPKPLRLATNGIFGDRQECQTIDQLKTIQSNFNSMYIEALLVRERLLGATNKEYRCSLFYRGAILADNKQYHEAVSYWIYELGLRQQYLISPEPKHLRTFASIFSEMLYETKYVPMDALLIIIAATIGELEHDAQNFNYNLSTVLFLITTTSQFLAKNIIPVPQCSAFYRHVCFIIQRNFTTLDSGISLLHLNLDNHTLVDDYHIQRICKYPCLQTARVLLRCGASVNAFDAARNTPLHVIASNRSACDESILNLLCDAGAHLDCVNTLRETPVDMALNLDTKKLLRSRTKLSLKCLCARLIRQKNVPFHQSISVSLIRFVETH